MSETYNASLFVTAEMIQKIDQTAIQDWNIPSLVLMENAARCSVEIIQRAIQSTDKILVLVGVGNNGGDGLAIARYLLDRGFKVKVVVFGDEDRLSEDAKHQHELLKKNNFPVSFQIQIDEELKNNLTEATVIIDALFGVGLNRELATPIQELIQDVNKQHSFIFAIDIPSGLCASTGIIFGEVVKANQTITFTRPKKGFLSNDGKNACGEIICCDIGIPNKIIQEYASQ